MQTPAMKQEFKIQMHRPVQSRKIDRERKQKVPRERNWKEHFRTGRIICKKKEEYEKCYHQFLSCKKCPMHELIGRKLNRIWCKELRCVIMHQSRGVRFSFEEWGKK